MFGNFTDDAVICKGWSELYRDVLIDLGFDSSKVKVYSIGDSHWYIGAELSDGKILVADATERMTGKLDISSSKWGNELVGFRIFEPGEA